jgi:hypothetical protein
MDLLDSRPEGLYRIKGYVDFGAADPRNRYAVHAVGRFLRFFPEPWTRDEHRRTQLVLIGSGIDAPALHKELEGCRVAAGRAASDGDGAHGDEGHAHAHDPYAYGADASGMWGVLRYVPAPDARPEPDPDTYPDADAYLDAASDADTDADPDPALDPDRP